MICIRMYDMYHLILGKFQLYAQRHIEYIGGYMYVCTIHTSQGLVTWFHSKKYLTDNILRNGICMYPYLRTLTLTLTLTLILILTYLCAPVELM